MFGVKAPNCHAFVWECYTRFVTVKKQALSGEDLDSAFFFFWILFFFFAKRPALFNIVKLNAIARISLPNKKNAKQGRIDESWPIWKGGVLKENVKKGNILEYDHEWIEGWVCWVP